MPVLSKTERLLLYFERMRLSKPPSDLHEAMALLSILNDVESELTDIVYDPKELGNDGRMYPPCVDYRYLKWERPGIQCYRQIGHVTFIAANGAIEIRKRTGIELGEIIFEMAGQDNRRVSDYDSSE